MTQRSYRVLVLDDEERWRNILHKALKRAGFIVETVASTAEFKTALARSFYHLLVFDISMEEGSDTNREGLDLVADLHDNHLIDACIIVILTAHGNLERFREAFSRYSSVDFFDKHVFDNLEFVRDVTKSLEAKLKMNRALEVTWNGGTDAAAESLVNLRISGTRVKKDTELHKRLIVEVDDLLARVFREAEMVIVTPMVRGRSGSGVVLVEPFYADTGGGRPLVLKFGDVRDIQTERQRYEKYVKFHLEDGRTATIVCEGQTAMLGGIGYSFFGASQFESFASFYRRSSSPQVANALGDLFLRTCARWYSNPGHVRARDLAAEYRDRLGCTEKNIADSIQSLSKHVRAGATLTFESLNTPLTVRNPLKAAFKVSLVYPTYECTTHGDLNDGNILVDHDGKTWLIDFLQTGTGHVLRDFTLLDVTLRCCSLGSHDATLDERLKLERALFAARDIDAAGNVIGSFDSPNERLQKAFQACLRLRALAAKQTHQHVSIAEMRDYFIATFFYALNMTRFFHLDTVQREHSLLSAALTAEFLGL